MPFRRVEPGAQVGGEPYGAFLRGAWIYTAWYNRELNAALIASPDDRTDAILDTQHPGWVIAVPGSTDPVEKKVVGYAQRHGVRMPLPGSSALWRIDPPR